MYAEGLDRLLEHDLLLRYVQTVLLVQLLSDFLGGNSAEQTAARAARKNGTPVILITCDKRSALAGHASYTLLASNRIQRIASDMLPSQLSAALVVEVLYYLLVGNFDLN